MDEHFRPQLKIPFGSPRTVAAASVLIIIALLISGYFIYSYIIKKPTLTTKSESEIIIDQVAKILDLPPDEVPTIATVTDIEKLKSGQNSPFFERAVNGDKVIVYAKSQKAVLYRPSTSKVVDVSQLNTESSPSAEITGAVAEEINSVYTYTIYNGTAVTGLAKKMEGELLKVYPESKIVKISNAKKTDYRETLLIDISGTPSPDAEKIAKQLGIKTGNLPEGEAVGEESRFLIIVGEDRNKGKEGE